MVIATILVMVIMGYKYSYITSEFYHHIKHPILLMPGVNNVLVGNKKSSFFSPNFEAFLNLETFIDYRSIVHLYLNFVNPYTMGDLSLLDRSHNLNTPEFGSNNNTCITPNITNGECQSPSILDINETSHFKHDTTDGFLNISQNKGATNVLENKFVKIAETNHGNNEISNENKDPAKILKMIRTENVNRLIIRQVNINSIRNKFAALKSIITGNLDILVITETKLDESFPDG